MFTQDNQTLYFTNPRYNLALILAELAKIVTNAGGSVKPAYHHGYIENRTFYECATEAEQRALRFEYSIENGTQTDPEKIEKLKKAAAELRREAAELRKQGEESKAEASHTNYIIFTLDGYYYNIDFSDNVFEDFHYTKTPIRENNTISRDTYREKLNKDFFADCFFYIKDAKPEIAEDRKEAANMIFNQVTAANPCRIYRETYRKRVPNYYNNHYHYETIAKPERTEKIDF